MKFVLQRDQIHDISIYHELIWASVRRHIVRNRTIKKSRKTPRKDIDLAVRRKRGEGL